MNKSKTNVLMENDTPIYMLTTSRMRKLKAASTWDRGTARETKTKTERFKEESRLDGQQKAHELRVYSPVLAGQRNKELRQKYFESHLVILR